MAEEKKEVVVKEVDEQTAECLLMPVTDLKFMYENLQTCIKDPNSLEPEAFGQLEYHFSKALNQAECPCTSGKSFSDCCRVFWRLAKSAWSQREDAAKKIRKEAHKAELKANDEDRKQVSKAMPICSLMLMPNGQIGVRIENDKIPLQQVAGALMEAYSKIILQMAGHQTMAIMENVMRQQAAQQHGQNNAPVTM